MKYHDVVIEAFEFHTERRPDKTRPARFKVRVLTSPAGELSQASAASVSYDTRDVDQQVHRLERRLLDVPGLIQFGRALSMLLFPPSGPAGGKGVRELFAESLAAIGIDDRARLRLVLPPELAALPWEYVYLDRSYSADSVLGFLALDPRVAIVRHELLPLPKPTPALKGDVKVFVALASGEGLPALDLDAEESGVHKALDGLPGIAWNIVRDATLDEVQQGMAGVGVFHFAGHGGFYLQPGTVPGTVVGKGELAFDDARVDAEQLAINLRGNGVRLAVLAGCETARRDGVAVWSGIAPLLVRGEIPAVVGNQFSIQDHCAIAFSQHFYRALAGGLPLEHAVTAGRIAAYNADQAGRDWGAPVLYLRAADGLLFDGAALEVVREEARHAAQIDVTARAKEVAAGGKIIGAVVKEMLEGKLAVRVEVDGAVYGTVIGLTLGRSDAGDVSVKTEASTVGKGGSLTGVAVDTLGRATAHESGRQNMASHLHASAPDFSSFVTERTEDFVGRDWVLRKLDTWLADTSGPRSFLLEGGPGSGKSAIAARLVQISQGVVAFGPSPGLRPAFLSYHHFCQGGLDSTLSPATFVQALSEALANRYPAFRVALETANSRRINIAVDQRIDRVEAGVQVIGVQVRLELKGGDARSLFDEAVRRPLGRLCSQAPNERVVLLIDSLDEALSFNADNNIVQLLRLTNDFPSQVRFVLTCRSKSDRVFDLVGKPSLDLIGDAPPGLDEVKQYALLRLRQSPEPSRSEIAERIAGKSQGNFLYAFHVLNGLLRAGPAVASVDSIDLPDELEDVYRRFLQRELAASDARWNDVYRPLLGPIAVAHGEGLTKAQLIGITDLAEDTATDVLQVCEQYLVGGEDDQRPWRIYHQSFRDFLLQDKKYNVFPAERHAAVARYFEDLHGSSWGACTDEYALRYAPVHWAEAAAAAASEPKRATRTQALVALTGLVRYQRQFEKRIGDLPQLQQLLLRATQVAAMNAKADMLVWIIRSAKACVRFRRDFLEAESLLSLAEKGQLDQAEARLAMFVDLSQDWQTAARLILDWLAFEKAPAAARSLHEQIAKSLPASQPLALLCERLSGALAGRATFSCPAPQHISLEDGRERVKRMSGQAFDREMLSSINPSLMMMYAPHTELINGKGYASAIDAPMLVHVALGPGHEAEGTALVDEYVGAHAGYNYVEYRNQSLWLVLGAVLRDHPSQEWVKQRLRLILSVALSGGGADFEETLALAAAALNASEHGSDAGSTLEVWRLRALGMADQLSSRRGANDSWGTHKRRLIAMMELYQLVAGNQGEASRLLARIRELPGGFAGFQAPAHLRLADAVRASGLDTPVLLEEILRDALISAHHIQDYHFCARVTSRCNALTRWHRTALNGAELADVVRRLAASPGGVEFAADHLVNEPFAHRDESDSETLSVATAREANTLEQMVEVFQRPALEFLRVNPTRNMSEVLPALSDVRVPDPGLPPLLAIHLSARVLADASLEAERVGLIRSLVPLTVNNATALDTVLTYLLIAAKIDDVDLLGEIAKEVGPAEVRSSTAPSAQVGPDVIPA